MFYLLQFATVVSKEYCALCYRGNSGRQNNGPKRCPHPNLRIYKYVTLCGKGDFADVMKLRFLKRWEIVLLSLITLGEQNSSSLWSEEAVTRKKDQERCNVIDVQGEETDCLPVGSHWKRTDFPAESKGNRFSCRAPRKKEGTLFLAQ